MSKRKRDRPKTTSSTDREWQVDADGRVYVEMFFPVVRRKSLDGTITIRRNVKARYYTGQVVRSEKGTTA